MDGAGIVETREGIKTEGTPFTFAELPEDHPAKRFARALIDPEGASPRPRP